MLSAMHGYVKNKKIITESDISEFEGMQLIITFLNESEKQAPPRIDFSKYGHRTERGQNVDGYMAEMREDDRL